MKLSKLLLVAVLSLTLTSQAQWEQSLGSESLDVQSLLSTTDYLFFGGATGTYRSSDNAYSFAYSNNGNDDVGPTRGFAQDENYIYTCKVCLGVLIWEIIGFLKVKELLNLYHMELLPQMGDFF
jgi:hypothetical protein